MQVLCIGLFGFFFNVYSIRSICTQILQSLVLKSFNSISFSVLVISSIKSTFFKSTFAIIMAHGVLIAAQEESHPSLPVQIMLLFLHSYTRWSHDRYIIAPSSKPNMKEVLSLYCSCPPPAFEYSCKLCSETKNELCSTFGIKGRTQPIDLKGGTVFRCLRSGAGAQDPSAVHGKIAQVTEDRHLDTH